MDFGLYLVADRAVCENLALSQTTMSQCAYQATTAQARTAQAAAEQAAPIQSASYQAKLCQATTAQATAIQSASYQATAEQSITECILERPIDTDVLACRQSNDSSWGLFLERIRLAMEGGVSVVQLREKRLLAGDFFRLAVLVKQITDSYGVPLIINDRVDIALAVDASGVHIGQKDLPLPLAKKLLGSRKIVGASVNSVAEAQRAQEEGADYLGAGAVFSTGTKTNTRPLSITELKNIKRSVKIPVVAIGGINSETLSYLQQTFIDGIAVASAILAQPDPKAAASSLLSKLRKPQQ